MENNQVIIDQSWEGKTSIDVKLENDIVWLNLVQLSNLFDKDKSVISRHLKNIYTEGEMERGPTVA